MVARGGSKVLGKRRIYFEEKPKVNTELIPGLPNDVTLQVICTKLPWRTFHVLSSVSTVWLGAIRSGEIYHMRLRFCTAETLALMQCFNKARQRSIVALYSLRDKRFYTLPTLPAGPLPRFNEFESYMAIGPHPRFNEFESYIAIRGKVYIVGVRGTEVWVLDLARQKKWQECASMLRLRHRFGCTEFEGKIYVFGSYNCRHQPIDFSEVYDPKVDAWTKISQMKSARKDYKTCGVQDEIWVHSGFVYDTDHSHGKLYLDGNWRDTEGSRDGIEAYNPAKDSWRTIAPGDFGNYDLQPRLWKPQILFTARGRLHCLTESKIECINLDENSVKLLHTVKFRSSGICRSTPFRPEAVLVTKDGFFTKGHFDAYRLADNKCRLHQSKEPVMGMKRITFEEVECSPSVSFVKFSHLEPIQL